MRKRIPVAERFWPKVDVRADDECWPWLAAVVDNRTALYGIFGIGAGELEADRRKNVLAHRAAFRLIQGHWPNPKGLHGCDNAICCNALNPEHVHEGTLSQNTQEMWDRRRRVPKLSDEQVLDIFARCQRGEAHSGLAVEYDVARAMVWYIGAGRHSLTSSLVA